MRHPVVRPYESMPRVNEAVDEARHEQPGGQNDGQARVHPVPARRVKPDGTPFRSASVPANLRTREVHDARRERGPLVARPDFNRSEMRCATDLLFLTTAVRP